MSLRFLFVSAVLIIVSCTPEHTEQSPRHRPARIISLDFCADQYVLKLVEKDRILALSPDATASFSYMRKTAQGIPTVRPIAEDALLLAPDLIIRAYGGGPNAGKFFERAGVPVLTIGSADTVEAIRQLTLDIADGLGAREKGKAVVAEMDARLLAINKQAGGNQLLYMTPAGVTTGAGSLVHDMILAAGLENFQKQPGWRSIPLERLAYESPHSVATSYFDTNSNRKNRWSAIRHPVARSQIDTRPGVDLPGAWTACGAWFVTDAIEALSKAGL